MKNCVFILTMLIGVFVNAQSKDQLKVLAQTRELEQTVFGTKDSLTLERLFAKPLIYVHSSGKRETRAEAIQGIINNKSTYVKSEELRGYDIKSSGDSLITTQIFQAQETKGDGTLNKLNISIELVWAKEQKQWKLFRRQATKIQ